MRRPTSHRPRPPGPCPLPPGRPASNITPTASHLPSLAHCLNRINPHPHPPPTGCVEISNLCANEYYGELLREAGAIEAVIEAVLRFPNSLRVQFAAVQAIANLSAGSNQARLRLGAAGTGRVLVQCLVRFSQDQVCVCICGGV